MACTASARPASRPSYVTFIAVVPVLFFNYVGFELPNAAGDEMKDPQKDVPFTVARSAIGTVLLYGAPILAILLVLPQSAGHRPERLPRRRQGGLYRLRRAHATNGTVTLTGAGRCSGDLAAIAFILALVTSGTTWIMGADRALAVASYDGAGPRILGTFSSRFGTPIVVNLLSGIVSTVLMLLASPSPAANANELLQRRARTRHLDDDDLLPGRLPGARSSCATAIPTRRAPTASRLGTRAPGSAAG